MAFRRRISRRRTVTQMKRDIRPAAHKRGYDYQWRKVRNKYIDANPLCEWCEAIGQVVDHKEPIYIKPDLRLDPTNLQTLCRECHQIKGKQDLEQYGSPKWDPSLSKTRPRARRETLALEPPPPAPTSPLTLAPGL